MFLVACAVLANLTYLDSVTCDYLLMYHTAQSLIEHCLLDTCHSIYAKDQVGRVSLWVGGGGVSGWVCLWQGVYVDGRVCKKLCVWVGGRVCLWVGRWLGVCVCERDRQTDRQTERDRNTQAKSITGCRIY